MAKGKGKQVVKNAVKGKSNLKPAVVTKKTQEKVPQNEPEVASSSSEEEEDHEAFLSSSSGDEFDEDNSNTSNTDASDQDSDEGDIDDDQLFTLKEGSDEEEGDASDEESDDDGAEELDESLLEAEALKTKILSDQIVNDMKSATISRADSGTDVRDEYEVDSSDEEDTRNTIGNVPIEWYDNYDHLGYDRTGAKVMKPSGGKKGQLEEFMSKVDDPNYWRTVKDRLTGENVVVTDSDADFLQRLKKGNYPDPNFNPYPEHIDFFTYQKMIHPVTNRPMPKAHFIPSLGEKHLISKMVAKIKRKWNEAKMRGEEYDEEKEKQLRQKLREYNFSFDVWQKEEGDLSKRDRFRKKKRIPAPKMRLPGHEESYRPPPEYLLTEEETAEYKERNKFIPLRFDNLRSVPGYSNCVTERFERCLDLYLCPRVKKNVRNVRPEDLIPKLPKPKDLHPFPTQAAVRYWGHSGPVRSIATEPSGQFIATASDDCTVKIWEVLTGRCFQTFTFKEEATFVSWSPNQDTSILAVVTGKTLILLNPGVGSKETMANTDQAFIDDGDDEVVNTPVSTWKLVKSTGEDKELWDQGQRVIIHHNFSIRQMNWHNKGDYFAVVMPEGANRSVVIHQLTKKRSQIPFKKSKGIIKCVLFHPNRAFLAVATNRHVRIYNLMKQELSKKLLTSCNMISSMSFHPGGDNLLIGSDDGRLPWFDLDLSSKPYKTMRYHKRGIRNVDVHRKYPLFASASDDGTIIVSHGQVYDDLTRNALIVPVKILKGHKTVESVGATDCKFHPIQPWIFSCGADHGVRLFT